MSSLPQNFEDYADSCTDDLSTLQEEFIKLYDIESADRWYYDNAIGAFTFSWDTRENIYFKHIHIGSFSTKANTWKWAWDNETVPVRVSRPLKKVKAFGEENGFSRLTEGLLDDDEYTSWEMTAVTAKLLSAMGAYRVPADHLFVYFIFTNELTQEEMIRAKTKRCFVTVMSQAELLFTLSAKDKQVLENKLDSVNTETTAQIDVVLMETVGKFNIMHYGRRLARSWAIGQKGKNNGVLILIALNDKKVTIITSYGLQNVIADSFTLNIINQNFVPHFKTGDYFGGLDEGTDRIIKLIKDQVK